MKMKIIFKNEYDIKKITFLCIYFFSNRISRSKDDI